MTPPKRSRGRPPGIPNRNAGRPRLPPEERTIEKNISFHPSTLALVTDYAEAHNVTFSQAVNQLIKSGVIPQPSMVE